jgi:hypothetical protein
MDGLDGDTDSQTPRSFPRDKDNFLRGIRSEHGAQIPVSYPSSGVSSPQGNSCREIPPDKNTIVDYPGRSVLYSRQLHPLDRILKPEHKKPPVM